MRLCILHVWLACGHSLQREPAGLKHSYNVAATAATLKAEFKLYRLVVRTMPEERPPTPVGSVTETKYQTKAKVYYLGKGRGEISVNEVNA